MQQVNQAVHGWTRVSLWHNNITQHPIVHRCAQLQQFLLEDTYIKPQWQNAIHWLQNEMERVSVTHHPPTHPPTHAPCNFHSLVVTIIAPCFRDRMLVLAIPTLVGHHPLSPMKPQMGMLIFDVFTLLSRLIFL